MQFRCAHLISVLDGCQRKSGTRPHLNHVPARPRGPAVKQATNRGSGCRRALHSECRSVDTLAIEDKLDLSCQRDHGIFPSSVFCNLGAPSSQPCRSAQGHHDGCGLAPLKPQGSHPLPWLCRLRHGVLQIGLTTAPGRPKGPAFFEVVKRAGASTADRQSGATIASIPGIVISRTQIGSS